MSQPYCKRPKRPLLAVSIFAMSGTVFSNRWPSKTRSRWVGCWMAQPAAPTNSWVTADRMSPGLLTANQLTTARISAPGSWRTKSTRAVS